jgi:TonB family protein
MFTHLLASQPVRQKSAGGVAASVMLHVTIVAAVVYATTTTAAVLAPVIDQSITYIEPVLPDPPKVEQPAVPDVPAAGDPTTGTIDVPVEIVKLADLPKLPTTTSTIGESELAGLIRRGTPVVGVAGDPAPGEVFSAAQVEVPTAIAKGSPTPRYPAVLTSTGIVGEARFRFVVDERGRVEMNTVEEVMSAHAAFSHAVRITLARMRFTPATVAGKPVRQLVELPFIFRGSK